jgi:hypothetical protein
MKQLLSILLFLHPILLIGQMEDLRTSLKLEVGYVIHFNSLNSDDYLSYMYPNAPDPSGILQGFDFKISIPTKFRNIEAFIGTVFLINSDQMGSTSWTPGNANASDFKKNGGGVFIGIRPRIGGKNFGLTSDFAVGVFSFKEYYLGVNAVYPPTYNYYEKKASYGLGAMSSIGAYARIGPVGIHPQIQAVFSGGSNASFFFYGAVIPLTIQF